MKLEDGEIDSKREREFSACLRREVKQLLMAEKLKSWKGVSVGVRIAFSLSWNKDCIGQILAHRGMLVCIRKNRKPVSATAETPLLNCSAEKQMPVSADFGPEIGLEY